MGIKRFIATIYAKYAAKQILKWSQNPHVCQQQVFEHLIKDARDTVFGLDHDFASISNYEDFKKKVPIRDYEQLSSYVERVKQGEENVLWKGKPIYLCKTSGTTSGAKFIPISKESISNHIDSARNALLNYINETGNADFVNGKMIFLQGNPTLSNLNSIPTGRLSGIVAHHVPSYLLKNRLPTMSTNTIDDWETKVDAIVEETLNEDMTLISGIPPWVQMYFQKLLDKSKKKDIKSLFKRFSLFVYGGVNYEPYKAAFEKLIGKKIDSIETYPASEGFIAFQNNQNDNGLLLILNKGIFYEFITASTFYDEKPERISLKEVKVGVNYVLILNTNAGLWGYNIGDTVKFVSTNPYKIIVTGRIKHFISAFGEHVIGEEVEFALNSAMKSFDCEVAEFHVAPCVNSKGEDSFHEWFIDFRVIPDNLPGFAEKVDHFLQEKNSYYKDLREGNMLDVLRINCVKENGFQEYMKSIGKLGGQNKLPRLANDQNISTALRELDLIRK